LDTEFSFEGLTPAVVGTVDEGAKTIALTVPNATDVTALVATFTNSAASAVKVGATAQTSGTIANDFASTVSYLVTAEDLSTATYTVTVTVAAPLSSDATLKASSTVKGEILLGLGTPNAVLATATGGTVTITAAKAADTTNLTTFITLFDKNDAGATVKVVKYATGGDTSGFGAATAYTTAAITDADFFIIQVTAADSSVLYYKVVVTVS
jgi:hypothetical protein